jgi:transcription termination factor Rho
MNTQATVFHSSLDKDSHLHVLLSNFILNHIKVELECGNDIILLIDSLTRMGRAYNRSEHNSNSRTMSGGLGSGALEIPRKLFGMARATSQGGSCTILATILKDTGSRMDEMIFQEFKGTGNCELILDRNLAEQRIFPAINLRESGTRKDELLLPATDLEKINILRRSLLKLDAASQIETLQNKMQKYPSNRQLLNALR